MASRALAKPRAGTAVSRGIRPSPDAENLTDAEVRTLATLLLISLAVRAQEGALSLEQLKSFEDRLSEVTERVIPATVGLQIGAAGGSGPWKR